MSYPRLSSDVVLQLADLRDAMAAGMIGNCYQPLVRMADRLPMGFEALARLNHPEHGTVMPDLFIPQLEDAGLSGELTALVSARAFADMAGPVLAGRSVRMSVNFSLDVLLQPAALHLLEEQRIEYGIPADRIVIELTESRPVEDFALLGRSLDHLRCLGYGAAIDDVGPAVPQLEPLLDLPFTSLKFDKDLVQQVLVSDPICAFLAATTLRGHRHGLTIVAEGVETDAIWNRMLAIGVDEAQGFLAARPLPLPYLSLWWDDWISRPPA